MSSFTPHPVYYHFFIGISIVIHVIIYTGGGLPIFKLETLHVCDM
jgi:hypothetical protein